MDQRRARRATDRRTRHFTEADRIAVAHTIGAVRRGQTWFATPRRPLSMVRYNPADAAKLLDIGVAQVAADDYMTEHWADALLTCPLSYPNRYTVRVAGKPYHWRQDYTGQLKLAAGESPW